jgi:N-acetylmuramoyl-L-alanine amidase
MRNDRLRHWPAFILIALLALVGSMPSAASSELAALPLRWHGRTLPETLRVHFDGREAYLPVASLSQLGVSAVFGKREETVLCTLHDGSRTEIVVAMPGGRPSVPVSLLAKFLAVPWAVKSGVLELGTPSAPAVAAKPAPKTELPAQPADKQPEKPAPKPEEKPAPTKSEPALPKTVPNRTVQKSETVAEPPAAKPKPVEKTAEKTSEKPVRTETLPNSEVTMTMLEVLLPPFVKVQNQAPAGGVQRPESPEVVRSSPAAPAVRPGTDAGTAAPKTASLRLTDVEFEGMDALHAQVRVHTFGKAVPSVRMLTNPGRLVVDLPNTRLETGIESWPVDHPFLTAIHLSEDAAAAKSMLTLDLSRLVAYQVVNVDSDGFILNLTLPKGVGRAMEDLVVVVDAGHGGSSTGCNWVVNGRCVYEKELTLSMALRVQKLLEDCGARVIMTRTSDTEVPLEARPAMAAKHNADLFVSIHVDDCPIPNSASGSTAYYHMDDSSSRAMAHAIISNVARVSGLPSRGAKSDRVRFRSGMAVLRGSPVPAVLLETAYINNANDRAKLMDGAFRQKLAAAVVDGIRDYIAGRLPNGGVVEPPPLPGEAERQQR